MFSTLFHILSHSGNALNLLIAFDCDGKEKLGPDGPGPTDNFMG